MAAARGRKTALITPVSTGYKHYVPLSEYPEYVAQGFPDHLQDNAGLYPPKILLVFLLMLVIAIFEALSILSLSFLALSVASPDKTMSLPLVRYAFDIFPSLHSLQSDVRIFAFWVALLVAGLTIVKNAMSALAGMRTAMLGEAVAQYAGETLFRYFLNSSYLDFLSGKTRQIPQVFSWRSQLGFSL